MPRPADLPFTEHFQSMPCGTRAKYVAGGCRCMLCRAANSRYETERALARKNGDWNGLVSAPDVRTHLLKLSKEGVGRRAVADAAGVARSIVAAIRSGKKETVRARTAARLLAVTKDAVADHALVSANRTWRQINRLLAEGFTKSELTRRLGSKSKTPALQLKRAQVTARSAMKVDRLYSIVMRG